MKLTKIISKNFKILLRSKSSALVLILGPLLLISLVGLAFNNTGSFSINIGYSAPSNNDLVDSYMSEIDTNTYSIKNFDTIDECINLIKLSSIHACIGFPADFEIKNGKTNEIKFYVDKSKINLVYSIIDTITRSFGRASTNLSLELTNDVLGVVTENRQGLIDAKEDLELIDENNEDIKSVSNKLQRDLNTIVIDTKAASSNTGNLDDISDDLKDYIRDQKTLATTINNHFEQLFGIIPDETSTSNATIYNDKKDIIDDETFDHAVEGSIFTTWNKSDTKRIELTNVVESLTSSVTEMLDDIDTAKKTQTKTSQALRDDINPQIEEQIKLSNTIKADLDSLVFLIDNIDVIDAENIVKPITTTIEPVAPENSHLGSLFPSLIVLLIMFISILISSNLVLMEKNSKAYFRNFTTPTNDSLFIVSTYLTSILMVIFQIAIVLTIATFAFDPSILSNIVFVTLLVLISSTLFVFIGMSIGYMFNTEETAMIGAISISSLFLLLSDLILPLESMPKYLIEIAKYNPFVLSSENLRHVLLFNVGFDAIQKDIFIMLGFSFIILLLTVAIQQIMKFTYLSNFSKKKVKITKKTNVKNYFKINDTPVKDLEGLVKVIRHMSEKDFKKHISKRNNIVHRWIIEVLKNVELADKIKEKRKKEDILFILKRTISQDNKITQKKKENTESLSIK